MKRLGIFSFYDKDGIVDRYVLHMLDDIVKNFNDLVIVCNGKLTDQGYNLFIKYTSDIYVRENKGFDFGGYKAVFTEYYGWDRICKYNEVTIFNDTIFAPITSYDDMFMKMDNEDCDFWSISSQLSMEIAGRTIPEFVQTILVTYRRKILSSYYFQNYFNEIKINEFSYSDVVNKCEFDFHKNLIETGYIHKTFIDANQYSSNNINNNFLLPYGITYRLIRFNKYPFLKKRAFDQNINYISKLTGGNFEDQRKSFDYINKHSDYDISMISESLLRKYNLYNLKNSMHLQFVLSHEENSISYLQNAVIVIYINDITNMEEYFEYIEHISNDISVLIYTSNIECLKFIKKRLINIYIELVSIDNLHQLFKYIYEKISEYEFLCFINIPMHIDNYRRFPTWNSAVYNIFENLIKDLNYVENVIKTFNDNPFMGYLSIPNKTHGQFLGDLLDTWDGTYNDVKKLLSVFTENILINEYTPCVSVESNFWCKTSVLSRLMDNNINDLIIKDEVFIRVLPYIAQLDSLFSGTVMNVDYASLNISNLEIMLIKSLELLSKRGQISDFMSLYINELIYFCQSNENIYVYGTGLISDEVIYHLNKHNITFEGYIVSDGQPKQQLKNNHNIYYLSEVENIADNISLILAVEMRNQVVILENIKNTNFKNIFCYDS